MKTYRISGIADITDKQIFAGMMPGKHIYSGGLTFEIPGSRTHEENGGFHVHDDMELFLVMEGKGEIEINGEIKKSLVPGDVLVIEPGEDHHLISDVENPLVILWCHAGEEGHKF